MTGNRRTGPHEGANRDLKWLAPLARRLYASLGWESANHLAPNRDEFVPSPAAPTLEDGESALEVACEIFDELNKRGRNPGFQSAEDVTKFADTFLGLASENLGPSDPQDFDVLLASRLLAPLDVFQFEIEFPGPGYRSSSIPFQAPWLLLGPYSLAVGPLSTASNQGGFRLSGVVPAGSFESATRRVEEVVDEFCGAMRCVGLAQMSIFLGLAQDHRAGVTLRTASEPGEPLCGMDPSVASRLSRIVMSVPTDLDDREQVLLRDDGVHRALERRKRSAERVLANHSARAGEVRGALRWALQAELSRDPGLTVALAFSCMEGLLLAPGTKDEVLGRISEAVAHSLARSSAEVGELRRSVKDLYGQRSSFVHSGNACTTASARADALNLMYRVLRRQIDLLETPDEEEVA